jgi:aspartate kinase
MSYSVVKIGGSALSGPHDAPTVASILGSNKSKAVFVVSAFKGTTDELGRALERGDSIRLDSLAARLAGKASEFAEAIASDAATLGRALERIEAESARLAGLARYRGADRRQAVLASGERFAAASLQAASPDLAMATPEGIGLRARLGSDRDNARSGDLSGCGARLAAMLEGGIRPIVPGFYGVAEDGSLALFGRGGSDYSAAILAAALRADRCELVKEGCAWRSADPLSLDGTVGVVRLSYKEAAALSSGGARILHPLAALELERAGIPLTIRSADGREWTTIGRRSDFGLKSIAGPKATVGAGRAALAGLALVGEGIPSALAETVRAFAALRRAKVAPKGVRASDDGSALTIYVAGNAGMKALAALHGEFFGRSAR